MTLSAAQDLTNIYDWIASSSLSGADAWLEDIAEEIESLAVFPRRCALAWEAARAGIELRQKVCGDYRVLFKVEVQTVFVEHVRHASRLPILAPDLTSTRDDEDP